MKKIITYFILSILALTSVIAPPPINGGVGSVDDECQDFDFDYGIVKWQCESPELELDSLNIQDLNFWFLDEEFDDDMGTSVTGTCSVADWDVGTSGATGIVVKGGHVFDNDILSAQVISGYHYSVRGTNGTETNEFPGMSHITFCGDEPDDEIPEFTVIGGLAVLAIAGLFIYARR